MGLLLGLIGITIEIVNQLPILCSLDLGYQWPKEKGPKDKQ